MSNSTLRFASAQIYIRRLDGEVFIRFRKTDPEANMPEPTKVAKKGSKKAVTKVTKSGKKKRRTRKGNNINGISRTQAD